MKIINGVGRINSDILILGEAPGQEEDAQGIPFVGRAGKLINKILKELNIKREDCYITNVVKVKPKNNKTPSNNEIYKWRKLLLEEIRIINPKIIIALGNIPLKALSGIDNIKITNHRGKKYTVYCYPSHAFEIEYIPTFHPSYVLRNRKQYDTIKKDLEGALEYVKALSKMD